MCIGLCQATDFSEGRYILRHLTIKAIKKWELTRTMGAVVWAAVSEFDASGVTETGLFGQFAIEEIFETQRVAVDDDAVASVVLAVTASRCRRTAGVNSRHHHHHQHQQHQHGEGTRTDRTNSGRRHYLVNWRRSDLESVSNWPKMTGLNVTVRENKLGSRRSVVADRANRCKQFCYTFTRYTAVRVQRLWLNSTIHVW